MTFHYGTPGALDFFTLVHQTADKEFEHELTRSTIPSLCWWDRAVKDENVWGPLGDALRLPPPLAAQLCFEYPVKSHGRNKPSFTDVMLISSDAAVAFEAKSTEPMDKTVKIWLKGKKGSENAQSVLRHWLKWIDPTCGLGEAAVLDCPYQMIHRTASVCSLRQPGRRLHVVHQIFQVKGTDHTDDFKKALHILAHAIEAEKRNIGLWLACVETRPTSKYETLAKRLPDRPQERSLPVRQAVIDGGLFEFGPCMVEPIQ